MSTSLRPLISGLAAAALISLSLAACDKDSEGPRASQAPVPTEIPSEFEGEPIEPSEFTMVEVDDLSGSRWEALPSSVSREDVLAAAAGGSSPEEAERFAVLAAQYFTDARGRAITNADLLGILQQPESMVGAYIVRDSVGQVILGSDRHLDGTVEPWIRSKVVSEVKLETQLNAYVLAEFQGESMGLWGRFRIDVVRDGEQWRVSGFNNSSGGQDRSPGAEDISRYFYGGEDWRRIPIR